LFEADRRVINDIPLGCPLFLPVHTVNAVQTLKAGKNVLLVLDDVWEREHANEFMFIDEDTPSTVLISSRVRGAFSAEIYTR
jgi:hypothetical protein